MTHRRYTRLVQACFADELDATGQRELLDHLRGCERCRAEFDLAAALTRSAAGREVGARELDRWSEQVLTRIAQGAAPPPPARGRRWSWAAGAVAAAALVIALTLVILRGEGGPPRSVGRPHDVQLRGADGGEQALVDIEVFAIELHRGQPRPRRVPDGGEVRLDEYLQLRYRNHSMRVRHLYLVAVGADGAPLDYFPRPDEDRSTAISEALSPVALPRSIRLAKRHRPGPLRIIGIFSEGPLARGRVHGALADLGGIGEALGPGVRVVVRRIVLTPPPAERR